MIPFCVFDVEIAKTIQQVATELGLENDKEAFNYPHKMGLSIGVAYFSPTKKYHFFSDAKKMAKFLLDSKVVLVSFNGKRFDLPVLLDKIDIDTFQALQEAPHIDILQDFYSRVNGRFRVGLDNIAEHTIGRKKTGSGANAPILFQENRVEELKAYCKNDVELTKDVFMAGLEKHYIMYYDTQRGRSAIMPVDWGQNEDDDV